MDLSAAIPGVDPWDIRGNSAGFVEFCSQVFGPGRGHWTAFALSRRDTRGKTRWICNIAAILKMKDNLGLKKL